MHVACIHTLHTYLDTNNVEVVYYTSVRIILPVVTCILVLLSDGAFLTSSAFDIDAVVGDTRCVDFPVEDDDILESVQDIVFDLGVVNSNDLIGENGTFTLQIIDNDRKHI